MAIDFYNNIATFNKFTITITEPPIQYIQQEVLQYTDTQIPEN